MTDPQGIQFIFFDVRDTLGLVYRSGHLTLFKPSTERLLGDLKKVVGVRMGVITNLPRSVSAEEGRAMLSEAGLLDYIEPDAIIINHEAASEKPRKEVYEYAARKVGLPIERCLFVGENFVECVGALRAGMPAFLKPFPPGGEFGLKPRIADPATAKHSGWVFETILEEDHILGKWLTDAAEKIAGELRAGQPMQRALSLLVYLLERYIDPYHHRKEEEAVLPIALARGLSTDLYERTVREHEQGRLYFKALAVAARRAAGSDAAEVAVARMEAAHLLDAFVLLYRSHGPHENDVLFPEIGRLLRDVDDAVIVELLREIGPSDLRPTIELVHALRTELGIQE